MRFKIHEKSTNFVVSEYNKQKCIACLDCGCVSFNPKDIEYKFCAFCNKFHATSHTENSNNKKSNNKFLIVKNWFANLLK